MRLSLTLMAGLIGCLALAAALAKPTPHEAIILHSTPEITVRGDGWYVGNRAPLAPSSVMRLPIGAITPKGWLRHMLQLEADGMTGHLADISPWLDFSKSAWASPTGEGAAGWEEMPYWLKGYGDLGYVLKDETITHAARQWIDAALSSQREDGWFGPRDLLTSINGKPDLWPNMVMLNILQSFYDRTKDPRVLPFMAKYFRWEMTVPDEDFLVGYWPPLRGGDNLESIYWLYNRTGEKWLLDVAKKVHRRTSKWQDGVANLHGVNFTQGFREPTLYWQQVGDANLKQGAERNYQTMMGNYGQVPGGMFGADENARPGHTGPRQGAETCSMVEFMHSFQMLTRVTGEPRWADRTEEIAFNSFPAALTPDMKALHYLTAPNQAQLDPGNKAPGIENGGTMFSYSPFEVYRCCQHNVSHGWPYYAEELWLATADKGLVASLYAASDVTAKVGASGASVTVKEETEYPFRDTIRFTLALEKPTAFPLYLRVPAWCHNPSVTVNGKAVKDQAKPESYLVLNSTWNDGDVVELRLPMALSVTRWEKNHDSVSLNYGPLTFALGIGSQWTNYGKSEKWPEWDVRPTTPWNYGLVLDEKDPVKSLELVRKAGPVADQPFTPETAPLALKVKARRIPAWSMDSLNMVGELQDSPVKSDEPVETLTLIPMGAARLRISQFPVIGNGPDAHEWKPTINPKLIPATASHSNPSDTLTALSDEVEPTKSFDLSIPRFTWWDRLGSAEWVQYNFPKERTLSEAAIYFFDDEAGGGGCRVPASWRLLWKDGDEWKPVEASGEYETARDQFNKVTFTPVTTTGLRLEAQLKPNFSGGILEWKVGG